MNVHLSNCTKTMKDGKVNMLTKCARRPSEPHFLLLSHAAPPRGSVFLRGSHVRFMVLPDILKNAPFFKKIDTKANKSANKQAQRRRTAPATPCLHHQFDSTSAPPLPQASRAKAAATQRAAGRPTPGMPQKQSRGERAGGGGRNPSFN